MPYLNQNLRFIYEQPKPAFKPGQLVIFEDVFHTVERSTHTHVKLVGVDTPVAAFLVRRYKKR